LDYAPLPSRVQTMLLARIDSLRARPAA
jgi:hypothetical protein